MNNLQETFSSLSLTTQSPHAVVPHSKGASTNSVRSSTSPVAPTSALRIVPSSTSPVAPSCGQQIIPRTSTSVPSTSVPSPCVPSFGKPLFSFQTNRDTFVRNLRDFLTNNLCMFFIFLYQYRFDLYSTSNFQPPQTVKTPSLQNCKRPSSTNGSAGTE